MYISTVKYIIEEHNTTINETLGTAHPCPGSMLDDAKQSVVNTGDLDPYGTPSDIDQGQCTAATISRIDADEKAENRRKRRQNIADWQAGRISNLRSERPIYPKGWHIPEELEPAFELVDEEGSGVIRYDVMMSSTIPPTIAPRVMPATRITTSHPYGWATTTRTSSSGQQVGDDRPLCSSSKQEPIRYVRSADSVYPNMSNTPEYIFKELAPPPRSADQVQIYEAGMRTMPTSEIFVTASEREIIDQRRRQTAYFEKKLDSLLGNTEGTY